MLRPREVEGRAYLPGVDGLRAVAVLAVMIFHMVPAALPGGFAGVDVFFVISGFVVTGSMRLDSLAAVGGFLLGFYARRFRRILPALLVCLMVTVLCFASLLPNAWLGSALRDTAMHAFFGLSNFVLVANQDGYFAPRSELNPFTHTWSLAVEEQFYLLFPALAYLSIAVLHRVQYSDQHIAPPTTIR
jgi:peptidoglycan/LPS O-acetylase OafA/YrhL